MPSPESPSSFGSGHQKPVRCSQHRIVLPSQCPHLSSPGFKAGTGASSTARPHGLSPASADGPELGMLPFHSKHPLMRIQSCFFFRRLSVFPTRLFFFVIHCMFNHCVSFFLFSVFSFIFLWVFSSFFALFLSCQRVCYSPSAHCAGDGGTGDR